MPKKKQSDRTLRQAALEKENLRLQYKIATLEAKLVSADNALLLRPYPNPEQKLADLDKAWEEARAMATKMTHDNS